MKLKLEKIVPVVLFLLGFAIGWLLIVPDIMAFGEEDGSWSASEKRQIIRLLRDIEFNTRP